MDYYSVLGVTKQSSQEDIKKAYRKLAMKHHPDRGGDESHFKKIQEAYDVLGDANKRNQYDNPSPFSQGGFGFSHGATNMDDFFSQMFGARPRNPTGKQTFRTTINLSLVDSYNGTSQTLHINSPQGSKIISIDVPRGVNTGDRVMYDNLLENAVLSVHFIVQPDLRFERRGNDLYSVQHVSILDLITGTKFKFKTIDQRVLEVKVPEKCSPNTHLKIPKAGMPDKHGHFGNQIILINPYMPDNIHPDIIETINKHKPKEQ